QSLFYGIQSFLGLYVQAFRDCANVKIRQKFKEFLLTEIELYDKLFEYGKMKGWLQKPPSYRVD
ncbi:MAG: spore coat protein, partial [Firmicutes bacterium]|nr:spore coat protein [Bacillota bacterium]